MVETKNRSWKTNMKTFLFIVEVEDLDFGYTLVDLLSFDGLRSLLDDFFSIFLFF
jgi:hypothetical protein